MKLKLGSRRIVRVNYSRIVNVPKIWLASMGLDVGDVVDLEVDEDGNLVLKPSKGGEK